MVFRKVCYYLLFTLVYCALFSILFLVSAFLLKGIYAIDWLNRILTFITFGSPEFILFTASSIVTFLACSHLAVRLDAHGPAFVFAAVSLLANVVLFIVALVLNGLPSLYSAQVFPAFAVLLDERNKNKKNI